MEAGEHMDRSEVVKILSRVLNLDYEIVSSLDDNESLRVISLNSIKAIQVIVMLEELIGVEFEEEDLNISKIDSINKILEMVIKYQSKENIS
jgi:acyl carrier protein